MRGCINQFAWQVLLAAGTRWRSMGGGLRGRRARLDSGDLVIFLAILAGVVLAVYLLSRFLAYKDGRKSFNSPRALFRALAKAHNLDRASRRLLRRVARWQRLAHPARLFLEPTRFDPSNLSPQLRERITEIQTLRDRIFAARIEELDLDQPAGQTPTQGKSRTATARITTSPRKPAPQPAPVLPTSASAIAPIVQTDGSGLQENQPTGTP